MRSPAPSIPIVPIDEAARDGAACLVSDGVNFATAMWNGREFRFPSGAKVPFAPVGYYRPGCSDA